MFLIPKRFKTVVLLVSVVGLLIVNKDYWHAQGYLSKPESFFTGIYNGTTDTGESAPRWSVRFMEKRPKSKAEIIEGHGEVTEIKRKVISREYRVVSSNGVRILENTLYFPGWTVLVDGRKQGIEFQDQSHRGLITFSVDKGEHFVNVVFKETKIRLFSDIVSLVSIITVGGFMISQLIKKRLCNKK